MPPWATSHRTGHNTMPRYTAVALSLLLGLFNTLAWAQADEQSHRAPTLNIAVARTLADTGVIDYLIQAFNLHYDIRVNVDVVGALTAIERGRSRTVDLVITHYPSAERVFLEEGYGLEKTTFIASQFAVFGPDEGLIGENSTSIDEVLNELFSLEMPFLAPSPRSGTYRKLEELWATASIIPNWEGYENTHNTTAITLATANEQAAYTLADIGYYLRHRDKFSADFKPLFMTDPAMINPYSAILVSGSDHPMQARKFYDYIVSMAGQQVIETYVTDILNTVLIRPYAADDPVHAMRRELQMSNQQQRLFLTIAASVLLLIAIVVVLYLYRKQSRSLTIAESDNVSKTTFLSNVSHEIRTPLNGILGLAEMLLSENLPSTQRKQYTQLLIRSAQQMNPLIDDLLNYTRFMAGDRAIDIRPYDLFSEFIGTLIPLRANAISKNLELYFYIDPALPRVLEGDYRILHWIISILGSNAVKYTDTGYVCFSLLNTPDENGNPSLSLIVDDTGPGMSEDDLKNVFTRYRRGTVGHHRDSVPGEGLGLSIANDMVNLLKGRIRVENRDVGGACFSVVIPTSLPKEPGETPSLDADKLSKAVFLEPRSVDGVSSLISHRKIDISYTSAQEDPFQDTDLMTALTDTDLVWVSGQQLDADIAFIERLRQHCLGCSLIVYENRTLQPTIIHQLQCAWSGIFSLVTDSLASDAVLTRVAQHNVKTKWAIKPSINEQDKLTVDHTPPASCKGEGRRILVADDTALTRMIYSRTLENAGYVVREAIDGNSALELLQTESFDGALIDVTMPGRSGLDVIDTAFQNGCLPDNTRITSANAEIRLNEYLSETIISRMGEPSFLLKPLEPSELLKVFQ